MISNYSFQQAQKRSLREAKKTQRPIIIFDLDGTVVDSYHRVQEALKTGTFCLQTYIRECNTAELIAKDTLLPLAEYMQQLAAKGERFAVITARFCTDADHAFLRTNKLVNDRTIHLGRESVTPEQRALSDGAYKVVQLERLRAHFCNQHPDNFLMYDDVPTVIQAMQESGITCIDAVHVNALLSDGIAGFELSKTQLLDVIGA